MKKIIYIVLFTTIALNFISAQAMTSILRRMINPIKRFITPKDSVAEYKAPLDITPQITNEEQEKVCKEQAALKRIAANNKTFLKKTIVDNQYLDNLQKDIDDFKYKDRNKHESSEKKMLPFLKIRPNTFIPIRYFFLDTLYPKHNDSQLNCIYISWDRESQIKKFIKEDFRWEEVVQLLKRVNYKIRAEQQKSLRKIQQNNSISNEMFNQLRVASLFLEKIDKKLKNHSYHRLAVQNILFRTHVSSNNGPSFLTIPHENFIWYLEDNIYRLLIDKLPKEYYTWSYEKDKRIHQHKPKNCELIREKIIQNKECQNYIYETMKHLMELKLSDKQVSKINRLLKVLVNDDDTLSKIKNVKIEKHDTHELNRIKSIIDSSLAPKKEKSNQHTKKTELQKQEVPIEKKEEKQGSSNNSSKNNKKSFIKNIAESATLAGLISGAYTMFKQQ